MLEAAEKPKRRPFESVDLREAGRRGGVVSGIARRHRFTEQLRQQVVTGTGMASYAAAQLLRENIEQREYAVREREREQRAGAEELARLREEAETLAAKVDALRDEEARRRERIERLTAAATAELAELERVKSELRQQVEADAEAAGLELVQHDDEADA
jgi:chromosome segregation ATPase